MKHLLFVVLENTKDTHELIHELAFSGFNGTVISSKSMKHVLEDENEDMPHFISLAHLSSNNFSANTTIYFILEDEQLEKVKTIIREQTKGFTTTKGGMFATPIESYEGSF